jgi:hypothetical protein
VAGVGAEDAECLERLAQLAPVLVLAEAEALRQRAVGVAQAEALDGGRIGEPALLGVLLRLGGIAVGSSIRFPHASKQRRPAALGH